MDGPGNRWKLSLGTVRLGQRRLFCHRRQQSTLDLTSQDPVLCPKIFVPQQEFLSATDAIPNGATPASSDRLAQRNLAIVESDNPGTPATHVVQHTLLVKPSQASPKRALASAVGQSDPRTPYDESVIRWNNLPRDTIAFYSPDWSADEILGLATLRPGPQTLMKVDANTITCPVWDITYIPIPGRVQRPIPGLMTLRLPSSVREGQQFNVDVQQHSGLTYLRTFSERRSGKSKAFSRQDYTLTLSTQGTGRVSDEHRCEQR
jgi:hypothetical protein